MNTHTKRFKDDIKILIRKATSEKYFFSVIDRTNVIHDVFFLYDRSNLVKNRIKQILFNIWSHILF